jgi:predicted double-glycine peptidase
MGAALSVPEDDIPIRHSSVETELGLIGSYDGEAYTYADIEPLEEVDVLTAKMFDELAELHAQAEDIAAQIESMGKTELRRAQHDVAVRTVPFYSQFSDISSPEWQKVGCGIASVSMLIEYYNAESDVDVDALLNKGRAAGYFLSDAGWTHAGLISLARPYGLGGDTYSLADLSADEAFARLTDVLAEGPVMASVHYTFEPTNPIPHLVVVNGVKNGKVYYNDPAEPHGGGSISKEKFQRAWKQRYIEIRPVS